MNNNFEIKINQITDILNTLLVENTTLKSNFDDLTNENIALKQQINELIEEKKQKSSSTLWTSINEQLKEKDILIEQLKKDIEFYKRQSSTFSTSSNIANKYLQSINKTEQIEILQISKPNEQINESNELIEQINEKNEQVDENNQIEQTNTPKKVVIKKIIKKIIKKPISS